MEHDLKSRVIAWVEEVLSDQKFTKIDVRFPDYDASGGYGSEMVMVNVIGERYETKEVLGLIIKRSLDGIFAKDNLNLDVLYANEVNLYSKIVPYLRKFATQRGLKPFDKIPYCYGTVRGKADYAIVMDNLKLKGYKLHDLKKPLDLHHTRLVLEAYAEWHALCFALRDQEPDVFHEFCTSNSGTITIATKAFQYMIATIEKELVFLVDIYRTRGLHLVADKLELLMKNFGNMLTDCMRSEDENYVVIRHGDCWNNNYLFHYDEAKSAPNKVAIIDWQVAASCSPMLDIAHFLFYCCGKAELELLDNLLMLYYDALSKTLRGLGSDPSKCFPWKNCLKSFNKYAPIGIAALPMVGKLRGEVEVAETYNITNVERDGNFNSIFNGKLKDPEEYFNKINEVLELSIERGFI